VQSCGQCIAKSRALRQTWTILVSLGQSLTELDPKWLVGRRLRRAIGESHTSQRRDTRVTLDGEIETLCCRLRLDQITRVQFIECCVRLASRNVGASRSALWIFIDTASGRALRCVAMHDRASDDMVKVRPHSKESADLFFDELLKSGQVIAHDARNHPATRGFFVGMPVGRGVQSLIATPFSVNGKLFGAFACTQLGDCVHWSLQHLFMLRRISIRATLAMAALGPRETALLTDGW